MTDSVRLPEPGKDHGNWGDLLNSFLSVAHHSDGTLRLAGGVGDYLQLRITKGTVPAHAPSIMQFEKLDSIRGSSLSWKVTVPGVIVVASPGIYAIQVTLNWRDSSAKSSRRYVQITAGDGFHTEEQVRSATGVETIQSLQFTVALASDQTIQIITQQKSDDELLPDVTVLVTKVVGMDEIE